MWCALWKIMMVILVLHSSLLAQRDKPVFTGKIVYEQQVILQADEGRTIPEAFLALEELKYITYHIKGPDTLIRTTTGVAQNLKSFTLSTKDETNTHFYESGRQMDFSALKKGPRVKVIEKANGRKGTRLDAAFACYTYKTSSGDVGETCYTDELPYVFPFNPKQAASLGFPLKKEGLLTERSTVTQVAEGLTWEITKTLVQIEYDEQMEMTNPLADNTTEVEAYERIETSEKDYTLIPPSFRVLPQISAVDLDGNLFDPSTLQNRITYIDLWASWCAPCISAFADLQRLRARYKSADLHIISLSIDQEKDRSVWEKVLQEKGLHWEHYLLLEDDLSAFRTQINLQGIPRYLILDKEGRIMLEDAPSPADPQLHPLLKEILASER